MDSNAAMIKRAYEAFARGDIAAVLGLVDDNVEWSSPETLPQGGQFRGRDGVGEFFERLGRAWSALALDVEAVCDAGDGLVIGVVHASGIREDGTPGGYGATHVFTVRNGRIIHFREYTDLDTSIA